MGFTLDKIVPWGRSFGEYVRMFGLATADLRRRMLGCGDGPAGFNASLTARGGKVVSLDPLYQFDAVQIDRRIAATYDRVMAQLRENRDDYVWNEFSSVAEVGRVRLEAMRAFLADFETGRRAGRYVAGALPALPFGDGTFDLALASHFLFLYSTQLTAEFHLQSLREMLRVAREVRIFPLLTLDGQPSPHLALVIENLSDRGFKVGRRPVPYEFQRGGNEMLLIEPA